METKNLGKISFEPESELEFPRGLPGFDARKRFVAVRFVESDPLLYLQSLEDPGLCFITMPILAVDPHYRLRVAGEDLQELGLSSNRQPRIGEDVMALTVVSIHETGPTANLLAPVVVNLRNRRAVQAVTQEPGYSHQHAILARADERCQELAEEATICS
ncbi:MAG TPA: flagellar assembly protein FliW [Candidatus Acidoferrales bacterium]|nr:flagellar assembly protein FliW [Candidatus Acidoferrales bacterium]